MQCQENVIFLQFIPVGLCASVFFLMKMKLMKKIVLFVTMFVSTVCVGFSQQVVTIEDCQQWAVSQSSANTQKELNSQLLKVKLNNAGSHLFPKLEINGDVSYYSHVPQLYRYVAGADTFRNLQYHISLDFEQVLFDGCKLYFGREYEKLQNEAEILKVELSINEMKEQIVAIYLNLLILDKQMTILSNAEATLEQQKNQMQAMQVNGIIPSSSVAQLEVEMLKVAQNKGDLKAKKESLISSLSILTGKDLSDAVFTMPEAPLYDNNSQSMRLEYNIFSNSMKTMDFQRKLHLSSSMPKITLFVSGGYGNPVYYDIFNPKADWYYAVGIRFKVPLIDWAKTSGVGNAIRLQKTILSSQQHDFEKANNISIQEKKNEIKRIEDMLVLDMQITEKQKEITSAISMQLLSGTISPFDYIKQQNSETQSLIDKEVHAIQLLKAQYELLALTGRL